jgi:prophage regulatory protein
MNQSFLRLPLVQQRTGLSRSTIYAFISRGIFPKPSQLGARSVGWLNTDIDAWIESRLTHKEAA